MPQISASVDAKVITKINKIAGKEKRTFSSMVDILLKEAVDKREKKSQHKYNTSSAADGDL